MNLADRRVRTRLLVRGLLGVAIAVLLIGGGIMMWPSQVSQVSQADPPLTESPPSSPQATAVEPTDQPAGEPVAQRDEDPRFTEARQYMVERDLRGRDITNAKVLQVMGRVPRHRFVPDRLIASAYADHPLPIGYSQTISQPYIVALMTQLADPKPESRALDIGTGSGYQAAVLAEICKEVYSIEIVKPLAEEADKRLKELGYKNITVRYGDGYQGWPDKAPFDVIILAAAPEHVPQPLVDQLAPGGKLVLPVGGSWSQQLIVIEKDKDGAVHRRPGIPVSFVPMTGEAQKRP